jgi:hypothetical protein
VEGLFRLQSDDLGPFGLSDQFLLDQEADVFRQYVDICVDGIFLYEEKLQLLVQLIIYLSKFKREVAHSLGREDVVAHQNRGQAFDLFEHAFGVQQNGNYFLLCDRGEELVGFGVGLVVGEERGLGELVEKVENEGH